MSRYSNYLSAKERIIGLNSELEGKVAIVTGGSSVIGRATTVAFSIARDLTLIK